MNVNKPRKSRRLELRLRKEIKDLKDFLKKDQKDSLKWKRRAEVLSNLNASKRQKIYQLERKVKYSEELVFQLKQSLSSLDNNKDKLILGKVLCAPTANHQRAPCKSLSLYVENYRNNKTNSSKKMLSDKRAEIKKTVVQFFEDDEISSPAPGTRDFITRKQQK